MIKRLLMTAAAVTLLATGGAMAQVSGKVGTGTTVGTDKPAVGSSTTGNVGATTKPADKSPALGGAARSETTGSSGSAGTGLNTGTGVGVDAPGAKVDGKVGAGAKTR